MASKHPAVAKETLLVESGEMTVELTEDGILHIDIPIEPGSKLTKSGTHQAIATTHGNATTPLKVNGKNLTVNLNAFTVV